MRIPRIWENKKIYIVGIGYRSEKEILRACDGWMNPLPHIDGMIWIGGKFDNYEGPDDTTEWLDLLHDTYGDKCDVITEMHHNIDQVDKRQRYLDLAGEAGADIAIAVDSEEYVHPKHRDFDRFYRNILMTRELLKDRIFYQWLFVPPKKLWSKQGNVMRSNKWIPSAKIHINPGTMRFAMKKHHVWASKSVSDIKMIQWQLNHRGKDNPYQFHPRITIDGVRVTMDRTLRTPEQVKAGKDWGFINQHRENSKEFYLIAQAKGYKVPGGCKTWEEWDKKPHTFDRKTGQRIEL